MADEWTVINHPDKTNINFFLMNTKRKIESLLYDINESGEFTSYTPDKLKAKITGLIFPHKAIKPKHDFLEILEKFKSTRVTEGTRGVYNQTKRKIEIFMEEYKIQYLSLDDINREWLLEFDQWLSKTQKPNSRSIHLRNIRAVFNYAIDEELTTNYPFRKFKIRQEPTKKRSLTVEKLRELFNYEGEEFQKKYIDIFKLMFFLVGINMVDLTQLKEITPEGRIEYIRAKTYRPYSIKVEPEAMEIINKYKGKNNLLDICDYYNDYRDYAHRMSIALQRLGPYTRKGRGGKKDVEELFPGLSPYWARHTWATIAADLDIPDAIISQALGHASGHSTTEIYIRRNPKKVDEANRKVIDYVLYDKR